MPQCSHCLKKGLFLKVDKEHNLCKECYASYGNDDSILRTLSYSMEYFSNFAFTEDEPTLNEVKPRMLNIIMICEKYSGGINSGNPDILYNLAIAYRNFCAWYIRGDQRKQYLIKFVNYMEKHLKLDPKNINAIVEYGIEIIENKPIRNLKKAIRLLEYLKNKDLLPEHGLVFLYKAYRWNNQLDKIPSFDLTKMNLYPGGLREARTLLRKKITECKKTKNEEQLKIELSNLYKLGLFESAIYGDKWDYIDDSNPTNYVDIFAAMIGSKLNDYSYENSGTLYGSSFLSKRDYSYFAKVWGETHKQINAKSEFKKELKTVYEKYVKNMNDERKKLYSFLEDD